MGSLKMEPTKMEHGHFGISSEVIFKEGSPFGILYILLLFIFVFTELFGEKHEICGQCSHISHSIYALIFYRREILHYWNVSYHFVKILISFLNPVASSSSSIMTVLTTQSIIDFPF